MNDTRPTTRERALGHIADVRALLSELRGATPNADLEELFELDPRDTTEDQP